MTLNYLERCNDSCRVFLVKKSKQTGFRTLYVKIDYLTATGDESFVQCGSDESRVTNVPFPACDMSS